MTRSKIIHIDGVGAVSLESSARAKRLSITIKPFKRPRVAVPRRTSFTTAEEFAVSRKDWIVKTVLKMKSYEKSLSSQVAALTPADRQKALEFLPKRLSDLAAKHGFTCNKVTIRNQKTRWGSCSAKNTISLNMQLIRLPLELIDYVILHELVHTRIKNHGPEFWKEMDRLTGSGKALRAMLKNYLPLVTE